MSKNSKLKRKTKDRLAIVSAVIILGMLFVGLVMVHAYTADIRYQNNELIYENDELKDEITALNIKILDRQSIDRIESEARGRYNMDYARDDQVMRVSGDNPTKKFAVSIKKETY